MRIISIDAGFAIVGWAILEKTKKGVVKNQLIDYGSIQTDSKEKIADRLNEIFVKLNELIVYYKPEQMAIESIFYFKNQKTIINVSQARGVIVLAGRINNLEVFDYTPLQVKNSITGYGRADKKQMQKMVKVIYNLKEVPKPDDVADAIAVGTCHLNSVRIANS